MFDSDAIDALRRRLAGLRALSRTELTAQARAEGFSEPGAFVVAVAMGALGADFIDSGGASDVVGAAPFIAESMGLVYAAADGLAPFGTDLLPALRPMLAHESEAVRVATVHTIRAMQARECKADLEHLESDPSPHVRTEALAALSTLVGFQAQQSMVKGLRDADDEVRQNALDGLAKTGIGVNLDAVLQCLRDAQSEVRKRAARILVKHDDPAKVPHLIEALKDKQYGVALYAMRGLKGYPQLAFDGVCKVMTESGRYVREMGAELLGHYGDPRGVPVLDDLARNSKNKAVRAEAAKQLEKLNKKLERQAAVKARQAAKASKKRKVAPKKTET